MLRETGVAMPTGAGRPGADDWEGRHMVLPRRRAAATGRWRGEWLPGTRDRDRDRLSAATRKISTGARLISVTASTSRATPASTTTMCLASPTRRRQMLPQCALSEHFSLERSADDDAPLSLRLGSGPRWGRFPFLLTGLVCDSGTCDFATTGSFCGGLLMLRAVRGASAIVRERRRGRAHDRGRIDEFRRKVGRRLSS